MYRGPKGIELVDSRGLRNFKEVENAYSKGLGNFFEDCLHTLEGKYRIKRQRTCDPVGTAEFRYEMVKHAFDPSRPILIRNLN